MGYIQSAFLTKRRKTRVVMVGNLGVGGEHPIRIQSMTTSNTQDVDATTEQIMRLADQGCEIVRVTVQGKKEAKACEKIKSKLIQMGYSIPIVADIHFYPPAALLAAQFVDKVRINPGNFVDKKGKWIKPQDEESLYQDYLKQIEEVFTPLVECCKKLGRSMRIGTNHGSLSERIMSRFGDTPRGMVESAFEFARICRENNYHELIFSMKASNPKVMIEANRLLVSEMNRLGWDYPIHLGVTEAGDGEDGRVKSAIGIGTLLLDGIGDTIRVSLTEDPIYEVAPCLHLRDLAESYQGKGSAPYSEVREGNSRSIKRFTRSVSPLHPDGSVILYGERDEGIAADGFFDGEVIRIGEERLSVTSIETMSEKQEVVYIRDGDPTLWKKLLEYPSHFILLEMTDSILHQGRHFFDWIQGAKLDLPVILVGRYPISDESLIIHAAAELGALLIDGLGEGVMLISPLSMEKASSLSYNLLQGCRLRLSKTEFIACPGCGRTLFDLQEVTRSIRSKTAHLAGVKIAIMGCIVNGPGEMADADFGYVGSGRDKIDLYVGKTCYERAIPSSEAVERLIDLIKVHGRWVDPLEVSSLS